MTTTAFTDTELLAQARRGDETAFAELYVRHESAARRLANSYARAGDPDDLVNEAFERVLKALRKGLGPTDAFRAYLFVTLRRLATDRLARSHDDPYDDMPEPVRARAQDPGLDTTERALVVSAYESLPERWQTVLWHTAVEGRQPRDLAPVLGMSANAAAALAYRAREKLRQAYLQAHLQATPRPECEPHRSRLGAYVRDGLGTRDRGATEEHIDGCSSCHGLVAELADVNRLLAGSLFPIFASAGEVAAALAATTTAVTGAATGTGAGGSLRDAADLGRRTWSRARSNPGATTAVIGALVLVAVVAGALIAARDDRVALPGAPPDAEEAAPPGDDPEPPEVPLVVSPPGRAEPIASPSEPPPTEDAPTTAPDPGPANPPSSSAPPPASSPSSPTTSSTRPSPPSSPPAPPGTEPPPEVPPAPTTAPSTTPQSPPAPPPGTSCHLRVRIGVLLDLRICLDVSLLGPAPGRSALRAGGGG